MSTEDQNRERLALLDDAWNAQDVERIAQCHKPDVVVYWPGKRPTHGVADRVEFCTVAHWDNGQISEEHLFYDLVTFLRQIGLTA